MFGLNQVQRAILYFLVIIFSTLFRGVEEWGEYEKIARVVCLGSITLFLLTLLESFGDRVKRATLYLVVFVGSLTLFLMLLVELFGDKEG